MKAQKIYDLPTRFFHWIFAGLFVAAFVIAKTIDSESPVFSYHMLAGLLLGFVVFLRLLWGVVGSRYARFSSFALHPRDLLRYFGGIVSGDAKKWPGHNPASSWASILMMGCALGLAVTGFFMAQGQKESLEDFHELFANGFLILVLLHIAGVLLHALRHRDGMALTMFSGEKSGLAPADSISSTHSKVAILFLVLVAGFSSYLALSYNTQMQSLRIFGSTLRLGEGENENEETEKEERRENEKDEGEGEESRDHDEP